MKLPEKTIKIKMEMQLWLKVWSLYDSHKNLWLFDRKGHFVVHKAE